MQLFPGSRDNTSHTGRNSPYCEQPQSIFSWVEKKKEEGEKEEEEYVVREHSKRRWDCVEVRYLNTKIHRLLEETVRND